MKVVLDTNVVISGILFSDGSPSKIIDLWIDSRFKVLLSRALIEEYLEVISRPKFKRLRSLVERQDILIKLIELDSSILVSPKEPIEIVKEDPDDNRILECAVEGGANYIISGDNHLLALKEYRKIPIVTPSEFLTLK